MEEEGACRGAPRPKPVLGGADDLISALPDELLLQILLRLGGDCGRCLDRSSPCSSAAARTSRLSRRWRRLWTRLSRLTIRHAPLDSGHLRSVLASIHAGNAPAVANPPPQTRRRPGPPFTDLNPLVPPPALAVLVPHLDICVPRWTHDLGMQHGHGAEEEIRLVLDAAVMLAPVDFRFAAEGTGVQVSFPRFHHATSIQLHGLDLVFTASGPEFPALQTLFLSRCRTTLSCWVRRSPHLRVLRVSEPGRDSANIIIVKSKSLQELSVDCGDNHPEHSTDHVRIEAPLLKQLTMSFGTSRGRAMNMLVSVSAPMLEKVSWKCTYATATAGLARWGLLYVILKPDVQGQLPNIHALSLIAETHSSYRFSGAEEELRFQMEVEKHMVFHFSMLELRIRTSGHVYGAFASRVLGMDRIKTVLKSLKIVLWRSENEEACPDNCPCDEPNWRTKSIYLPKLEEVEIKGFKGEDHELDFWKLVIARAPKLKRVVMVRPSYEVTSEMRRILQTYGLDKILVLVVAPVPRCKANLVPVRASPSFRKSTMLGLACQLLDSPEEPVCVQKSGVSSSPCCMG